MRQILRDIRRGRPVGRIRLESGTAEVPGLPAQRWWDQFLSTGGSTFFDEAAGVYLVPKKTRVTMAEAVEEIENFHSVRPRCIYFSGLYTRQLEAFLQSRLRNAGSSR